MNISNFHCVPASVFVVAVVFFEGSDYRSVFLQKVYLYIWAVAGHEVGILSI